VDKRQPIRLSVRLREDAPGISPFITSIITISISLRDDDSLCMQIDKSAREERVYEKESRTKNASFWTCEFYEFASFRTERTFRTNEESMERTFFRVFKGHRESFKRTRPHDERSKQLSRDTTSFLNIPSSFQALKDELRAVSSVTTSFQVIQSVYENCVEFLNVLYELLRFIESFERLQATTTSYCRVEPSGFKSSRSSLSSWFSWFKWIQVVVIKKKPVWLALLTIEVLYPQLLPFTVHHGFYCRFNAWRSSHQVDSKLQGRGFALCWPCSLLQCSWWR